LGRTWKEKVLDFKVNRYNESGNFGSSNENGEFELPFNYGLHQPPGFMAVCASTVQGDVRR
jgi:hypothetical protein